MKKTQVDIVEPHPCALRCMAAYVCVLLRSTAYAFRRFENTQSLKALQVPVDYVYVPVFTYRRPIRRYI
jgi:hypothetical protein